MAHPLQPIFDTLLDGRTKGFPQALPPTPLGHVGGLGLRLLEEGEFPAAILRQSALDRNAQWMGDFLRQSGTSLCPHGKTTMAPQLFHRQIQDGAWGITLATPQQVQVAYAFGIKRILLANELTSQGAIRWICSALDTDPLLDFTCLVDSLEGIRKLRTAATHPIPVLLELGIPGGRTGFRTMEEALEGARAVKAAPTLKLRGVECFEGILITEDRDQDLSRIQTWLEALGALAIQCQEEGLFETEEVLLSAGGSAYFDLVASSLRQVDLGRPSRILLRSGCCLTHDAGHYQRLVHHMESRLPASWRPQGHLAPALEVWGQVLSRPEPTLAFLDIGKRDISHDLGLPQPCAWFRRGLHQAPRPTPPEWRIVSLYDQHAKVELPPEADLAVGDLLGCAISHPCTTFDKWQVLFVVDEDYRVIEAIKTFF